MLPTLSEFRGPKRCKNHRFVRAANAEIDTAVNSRNAERESALRYSSCSCFRNARVVNDDQAGVAVAQAFDVAHWVVSAAEEDASVPLAFQNLTQHGWTIDVLALRHTFGTLQSQNGVAPRTAQAAMRHSSIDLTMNVYTNPRLLDGHFFRCHGRWKPRSIPSCRTFATSAAHGERCG